MELSNPVWIGIVGTILALVIIGSALRTMRRNTKGGGLMKIYLIVAVMFIGVIWFIILRLMPAA